MVQRNVISRNVATCAVLMGCMHACKTCSLSSGFDAIPVIFTSELAAKAMIPRSF
jgi:hypothetical protein